MTAGPAIAFEEVQANILLPYARANCGRLLCVRFDDDRAGDAQSLGAARAWLDAMRGLVTFHSDVRDAQGQSTEQGAGPWFNVALTAAGLQALGFDPFTRKYLPAPFLEGMHARRARLGDGAHDSSEPSQTIHAIVLCYAYDDAVEAQARKVGDAAHAWEALDADQIKDLEYAVDCALAKPLERLPRRAGVRYVTERQQDMYRLSSGEVVGLEYFGFRDGIAQPRLHGVPSDHALQTDTAPGAVLLGHAAPKLNEREPDPEGDETREQLALGHLAHGSFLVVRSLVQDVEGFRAHLRDKAPATSGVSASELAEYMMGRRRDGTPLVGGGGGASLDDFTYQKDPNGRGCPFHAHARRVNPRDERSHVRRLMRRGMPTSNYRDERGELGLLFMAYNADIESQFEFVQRQWVNAGAESHGLSADRDPIAGDAAVLRGTARDGGTFSFMAGATQRACTVTGLQSHVHAGWGEYALVPSRRTLAELAVEPSSPIAEYERRVADIEDLELRRDVLGRWLDDPEMCRRIYAEVRARGGAVRIARDAVVLVGTAELVAQVAHDDGSAYSVARQGEAMRQTTGAFYLGMDAHTEQYKLDSQTSCAIIPGWQRATELWDADAAARAAIEAAQAAELAPARAAVLELCLAFLSLSVTKAAADHRTPGRPQRGEIVLTELAAFVLSGLTPKLFGVPQPSARGTIALNVPPSGYTFFAFPDAQLTELAEQASRGLTTYLTRLFDEHEKRKNHDVFPRHEAEVGGDAPENPYVAAGQKPDVAWQTVLGMRLDQLDQMFAAQGRPCRTEDRVRLMAGVISGMLITSFKVFTDGVGEYMRGFEPGQAIEVERAAIPRLAFSTMKRDERSMPNIIYRRVCRQAQLGKVVVEAGDVVLASQGSAMASSGDDWFYGDRTPAAGTRPRSPHFCPGYLLADAIIESMTSALFSLPDVRRASQDGEPAKLSYDWAPVFAKMSALASH